MINFEVMEIKHPQTLYSGKGLTGLLNLGNSCYMNSVLQIIGNIHELNIFIDMFLTQNSSRDINSNFIKEWNDLRKLMWSKNVVIAPKRFKKTLEYVSKNKNNELFAGDDQNDATEFLNFLMNIFHETLKQKHSYENIPIEFLSFRQSLSGFDKYFKSVHEYYSCIDLLFSVYLKTEYIEITSENILATKYENMYAIDLPLNHLTIEECMKKFLSPEELNKKNNNQYYDENEKIYKDVKKKTTLVYSSKYLIIQLKRWNKNLRKNQRIIHFDLNKELSVNNVDCKNVKRSISKEYKLVSIINHSGNIDGGHYTCVIKNENGKWYDYNDGIVKEIVSNKIICNKNYCLIYSLK